MKRPLFSGLLLHVGQHLRELLVVGRRGDDELHRRAAGRARQRGRREGEDLSAGDARDLRLQLLQDLLLRAVALVPRLEQDARERLVHVPAHAVDGEHVLLLGHRVEHLVEVLGDLLEVVEVGALRRLDEVEQDALVFLGRQLLLRGRVHEPGRGDGAEHHEHGDGPIVERARQPALIAMFEALEGAVEEAHEAA